MAIWAMLDDIDNGIHKRIDGFGRFCGQGGSRCQLNEKRGISGIAAHSRAVQGESADVGSVALYLK